MRALQEQMNQQTKLMRTIFEICAKQEARSKAAEAELAQVKEELQAVKDELQRTQQQMGEGLAALMSVHSSPNLSYADVVRTAPNSQPSNVRTLSSFTTTPPMFTDTIYCTVDTSRVETEGADQLTAGTVRVMVEKGIRADQDRASWRCQAVTTDPRNANRIRVACRSEAEQAQVKKVIEANLA